MHAIEGEKNLVTLISANRYMEIGGAVEFQLKLAKPVRHGFGERGGTIRIELSRSGPFAQCCVMDDGSSRGCHAPGEGLKIVEALARELNGEIAHRFGPEGARSIVIFPNSAA